MFNKEKAAKITDRMLKDTIYDVMSKYDIKQHLKGYEYISYLLFTSIKENFLPHESITVITYPKVAKEYNTTPSRVERNIRQCIRSSSDIQVLTNANAIAILYRKLLVELDID